MATAICVSRLPSRPEPSATPSISRMILPTWWGRGDDCASASISLYDRSELFGHLPPCYVSPATAPGLYQPQPGGAYDVVVSQRGRCGASLDPRTRAGTA